LGFSYNEGKRFRTEAMSISLCKKVCAIPAIILIALCYHAFFRKPVDRAGSVVTSHGEQSLQELRHRSGVTGSGLGPQLSLDPSFTPTLNSGESGARDTRLAASSGGQALLEAAANGSIRDIEELLENGGDPDTADENGRTLIMLATEAGHADVLQSLLAAGANPNLKGTKGESAIELAVRSGDEGMVGMLLDNGAKTSGNDNSGLTALMLGVRLGYPQIVRRLLEAGADVNASGSGGQSALALAAASDRLDLAKQLLDRGANPNVRTETGTVLTDAVAAGNAPLAKALISRGADIRACDSEGRSAMAIATASGNKAIAELIQKTMVKPDRRQTIYGAKPGKN
jgi:ankyrin repeat protein